MKTKFHGLHLWSVAVKTQFCISQGTKLQIVTDTNSAIEATRKAIRFVKSEPRTSDYYRARITAVEYSGTLDA